MSTNQTIDLLRDFLKQRAGVDPASVTRDASLQAVNIDSLMLLELLFEMEEKLGISIPNDMPTPENVGALVDLVDQIRAKAREQGN